MKSQLIDQARAFAENVFKDRAFDDRPFHNHGHTHDVVSAVEEIGTHIDLTDDEMEKFDMGAEHVSVYVPQAYNFAGQLYILPRNKVRKVGHLSSGEAMKYAVTGGVVHVTEDEKSITSSL